MTFIKARDEREKYYFSANDQEILIKENDNKDNNQIETASTHYKLEDLKIRKNKPNRYIKNNLDIFIKPHSNCVSTPNERYKMTENNSSTQRGLNSSKSPLSQGLKNVAEPNINRYNIFLNPNKNELRKDLSPDFDSNNKIPIENKLNEKPLILDNFKGKNVTKTNLKESTMMNKNTKNNANFENKIDNGQKVKKILSNNKKDIKSKIIQKSNEKKITKSTLKTNDNSNTRNINNLVSNKSDNHEEKKMYSTFKLEY